MTCYEKIEIFIGIITTFTALVSILISVFTLRQNNKMIEENTRPYIVVYGYVTNFGNPVYTIAVKNFGGSAAKITKFQSRYNLNRIAIDPDKDRIPFDKIVGTFMPPGFSIIRDVNWKDIGSIEFEIEYAQGKKKYKDAFNINFDIEKNNPNGRVLEKDITKTICYSLQEYIKRNI